ncbi:MAG TPA: hypothetical protein VK395_33695 [Gemmataceae bacterium]|nr:hypothetical protein [Gemmataceae bacterium]
MKNAKLLLDAEGAVVKNYGAEERTLFLTRPDGYVGYRAQSPDPAKFLAYLKQIFI